MGALLGPLPAIFMKMDQEGVSSALLSSNKFTNTCSLSCSMQTVEALRRLFALEPRSRDAVAHFAESQIALIDKTVGRAANSGLAFDESLYVLNLFLRNENLLNDYRPQIKKIERVSDLNLQKNEIAYLPVELLKTGEKHMLLVYYAQEGQLLAFDPNQGRTVALTIDAGFNLGPYKAFHSIIRISPRGTIPFSKQEQQVDHLNLDLIDLKKIIEMSPLQIDQPDSISRMEAKELIDNLLTSLQDARPALSTNLSRVKPEAAAAVLEIRHRVIEIHELAEKKKFFNYLRQIGLSNTSSIFPVSTSFDLSKLEPIYRELDRLIAQNDKSIDSIQVLKSAIQQYVEIAMQMVPEMQPTNAHRQLTPLYEKIKTAYELPAIQNDIQKSDLIGELLKSDWSLIESARRQFKLN